MDKLWLKNDHNWVKKSNSEAEEQKMYTMFELPNGASYLRTPDNYYEGVACINIDVSFSKNKVDLDFDRPKSRKLNQLEKVKRDLFKYPQNNISQLFSSLIKGFENDDLIYVLKFLCVYQEDELNEILADLDYKNERFITVQEQSEIIEYLRMLELKLDSSGLTKINEKQFELEVGNDVFNLIVEDGFWKINPYSYKIHK
jgi:hypothetical protein